MNTAWNRWCRNLPSGTALSLYDNRITPIIITDITGRRNVSIQNPYTCTTSSGQLVQVYGFCIRTLRLPVISVMINGVMRLSYNERAVPDGRFRHHLFQAVFMRTTYPSRCVYFGWSRLHTAVESAATTPVGM